MGGDIWTRTGRQAEAAVSSRASMYLPRKPEAGCRRRWFLFGMRGRMTWSEYQQLKPDSYR